VACACTGFCRYSEREWNERKERNGISHRIEQKRAAYMAKRWQEIKEIEDGETR